MLRKIKITSLVGLTPITEALLQLTIKSVGTVEQDILNQSRAPCKYYPVTAVIPCRPPTIHSYTSYQSKTISGIV